MMVSIRQTGTRGSVITDMINGTFIEKVRGDDLFDDLFQDLLPQVLGRDVVGVLSGDDDGVDSEGDNGTTVALVLDGHLGLGVWSEPGRAPVRRATDKALLSLWARTMVSGINSGVSEVAYPNMRP
jgi:hypothetical protein